MNILNLKIPLILSIILLTICLTSCGSDSAAHSTLSYDETKTMVLDILKSDDGQKAISKAGGKGKTAKDGSKIKMLSTMDDQQIQLAVKNVMTDPNYAKFLKDLMIDPRFAGEFAKAINKENKQIHKDLLKDPEYQLQIMDIMKNSDMKKIITTVMKGPEIRQQAMTLIEESMKSPLFRVQLIDLMKKALEEEAKPKKKK